MLIRLPAMVIEWSGCEKGKRDGGVGCMCVAFSFYEYSL